MKLVVSTTNTKADVAVLVCNCVMKLFIETNLRSIYNYIYYYLVTSVKKSHHIHGEIFT